MDYLSGPGQTSGLQLVRLDNRDRVENGDVTRLLSGYGRVMKSPLYAGGVREKSNVCVRTEIRTTPEANIQNRLSHRRGPRSALSAKTTSYCLALLLRAIVLINSASIRSEGDVNQK